MIVSNVNHYLTIKKKKPPYELTNSSLTFILLVIYTYLCNKKFKNLFLYML